MHMHRAHIWVVLINTWDGSRSEAVEQDIQVGYLVIDIHSILIMHNVLQGIYALFLDPILNPDYIQKGTSRH